MGNRNRELICEMATYAVDANRLLHYRRPVLDTLGAQSIREERENLLAILVNLLDCDSHEGFDDMYPNRTHDAIGSPVSPLRCQFRDERVLAASFVDAQFLQGGDELVVIEGEFHDGVFNKSNKIKISIF